MQSWEGPSCHRYAADGWPFDSQVRADVGSETTASQLRICTPRTSVRSKVFWWPSSLAYFVPPAIVLGAAVFILARHEPRRQRASTLSMLGMPVVWACVGILIGFAPVVVWMLLLGAGWFLLEFLWDFVLIVAIMFAVMAVPMAAVSLAVAKLGTPALSRLMRWMAVGGGGSMLVASIFGMQTLSNNDPTWLAALVGFSGASLTALFAAPRAHLAEPSKRTPSGMCPACGYDITGLDRCPECGVEVTEP